MTPQQTAPASANLLYRLTPLSFSGVAAFACCTAPSSFPVAVVEDMLTDEGGSKSRSAQLRDC